MSHDVRGIIEWCLGICAEKFPEEQICSAGIKLGLSGTGPSMDAELQGWEIGIFCTFHVQK